MPDQFTAAERIAQPARHHSSRHPTTIGLMSQQHAKACLG